MPTLGFWLVADRAKKSGASFITLFAHSSLALSNVWMGLWDMLRGDGRRTGGKAKGFRRMMVGPQMEVTLSIALEYLAAR